MNVNQSRNPAKSVTVEFQALVIITGRWFTPERNTTVRETKPQRPPQVRVSVAVGKELSE
jgi:hypothetical protein